MKSYLLVLFTLLSLPVWSQQDTTTNNRLSHAAYERHSVQTTLSLGFIDGYRPDLAVPTGFEKSNTSGYANISAKVDYGLSQQVSLAAAFGYDAFIYNFNQLYTGYNGVIRRYKTNNFRAWSLGLTAYYHLGKLIHIKHLDPFVGAGIALNNLRYSSYPQGDSTITKLDHTVTPYLKVGAHYYISNRFSIFGDVGYEKQSIFSLGFSCRFFAKNSALK